MTAVWIQPKGLDWVLSDDFLFAVTFNVRSFVTEPLQYRLGRPPIAFRRARDFALDGLPDESRSDLPMFGDRVLCVRLCLRNAELA